MRRSDGRGQTELRAIKITRNYTKYAKGSVLIEMGNTKVICTASVDEKVPNFLRDTGKGWVTSEYSMLPSSTEDRIQRERFKVSGRTYEIQRLIGRSLRAITDLDMLGERSIYVDCDVIQADGGTRTASITGAFIALNDAATKLVKEGKIKKNPLKENIAAVSVGMINGKKMLDLNYIEDSSADVDMNVVMTESGKLVEIQGTSEKEPFSQEDLNELLELAEKGIRQIMKKQKSIYG